MRYPEEVIVRGIGRWAKEAWEKEWVNKEMWTDHKELAASLVSEIWPQRSIEAASGPVICGRPSQRDRDGNDGIYPAINGAVAGIPPS